MKFLHLMKREKFTQRVAEFYDCYFNNGEHEICYINEPNKATLINPQLTIKQTETVVASTRDVLSLIDKLKEYDYIVMHSLFFMHYALLFHPKLVKKIVWIAWGYDLYNYPIERRGLKSKAIAYIGNYIRTNCAGFVAIFPPDRDTYRQKFPKSKAKVYYAPYGGAKVAEELLHYSAESNLERRKEDHSDIYIQVGHSAVKSVNHIDVLKALSHLSQENIKVLLPLSYGDQKYADEVQEFAHQTLGDKAICLREFMPLDEYFELIRRVDVAVFNTSRQIALGNINRLAFRNVKIYMPSDSIMYKYFVANGVPIERYEDLAGISVEELAKPVKIKNIEAFEQFIDNLSNIDRKVKLWDAIYNDLSHVAEK